MSQYKASMARMGKESNVPVAVPTAVDADSASSSLLESHQDKKDVKDDMAGSIEGISSSSPPESSSHKNKKNKVLPTPWFAELWQNYILYHIEATTLFMKTNEDTIIDYLLLYILPAIYVPLLMSCMKNMEDLVSTLHLPFLGIIAGVVSNSLPIGPGVIYMPLLVKLIEHDSVHLSIDFIQASWAIGSGVVGTLQWMKYDNLQQANWYSSSANHSNRKHFNNNSSAFKSPPRLIIWESLSYTIIPCWLGTLVGMLTEPELNNNIESKLFGIFCIILSLYLIYRVSERIRSNRLMKEAAYSRGLLGFDRSDQVRAAAIARKAVPTTFWDILPDSLDKIYNACYYFYDMLMNITNNAIHKSNALLEKISGIRFHFTFPSPLWERNQSSELGTGAYKTTHGYNSSSTTSSNDNILSESEHNQTEDNSNSTTVDVEASVDAPEDSTDDVSYASSSQTGSHSRSPLCDDGHDNPVISVLVWYRLVFVSFMTGLVLLPNIGAGPSLVTYSCLLLLGYSSSQAMVTSVVTGGICCWCPFFIHSIILHDIPSHVWPMWAMVLPGMAIGAWAAPRVSERIGPKWMEILTGTFLLLVSFLFI
jgi:uncharacterized membrane protein YfcA